MKKFLLTIIFLFFGICSSYAAEQIKVMALEEFSTKNPKEFISLKVLEENTLLDYKLDLDSILYCKVVNVVNPKRGKRNASFWVSPVKITTGNNVVQINEELYGKYSSFVLSKEALKNIEPFDVAKKSALTVGNHFVKGISIVYSFFEGVVKNENDNRIKSGFVNAYEESPISLIEDGKDLEINIGDDFYLVFKFEIEK